MRVAKIKSSDNPNAGEDTEKLDQTHCWREVKDTATLENSLAISCRTKHVM